MPASDSRVLFLLICSDTKTREGERPGYDPARGICRHLGQPLADKLLQARKTLRNLLADSDEMNRDGRPLRSLPYNADLAAGPDFGTAYSGQVQAMYLPAARRYRGRFYRELAPDGPELLLGTPHHVLIVSGLYGLLTPAEPIQCYSCHVPDHPKIARQWRTGQLLTKLVVAYVQRYTIERVFDFMGDDNYRDLLDWDEIRHVARRGALHGCSNQFARENQLLSLGYVARRLLPAESATLMGTRRGDTEFVPPYNDDILFRTTLRQTSPSPQSRADSGRRSHEDNIVRMRINVRRMLECVTGQREPEYGFPFGCENSSVNSLLTEGCEARWRKSIGCETRLYMMTTRFPRQSGTPWGGSMRPWRRGCWGITRAAWICSAWRALTRSCRILAKPLPLLLQPHPRWRSCDIARRWPFRSGVAAGLGGGRG